MKVTDSQIIDVARNSHSAAHAASTLGIHFNTFKTRAKKLGVYFTNQSGKGVSKDSGKKIPLTEILKGNHPQYQSNKLRIRLFAEGLKEQKCEECGIVTWNGKPISFELHHVNGNRTDHTWKNLKILCPICHSQTDSYRGKNK